MENKIKAIKFDMGSLPVDNPDELDFIELEEFPGQVMVTKKGHKRSLEIILTNAGGDNDSTSTFRLNSSFAYWKPKIENGNLMDVYSNTNSEYPHYGGRKNLYGKIPRLDKKDKYIVIDLKLNHYEFYSIDKDRNIHSIEIELKYVPSKDLTKFTVLYDNNILLKLDTRGNYSLKHLKALSKGLAKKEGNLLAEKDLTLYLNNDIPVKICAEPSEKKDLSM